MKASTQKESSYVISKSALTQESQDQSNNKASNNEDKIAVIGKF